MDNTRNTHIPFTNITDAAFNNSYAVDVLIISATSCSLSILGGIVIIATFIAMPNIRNFARKLVVSLTVADVISAAAYLVSVIRYVNKHVGIVDINEENILCKIQSFCTTYSSIVSFFLTSIIAIYIFDTVINEKDRLGTTAWLVIFNTISWIIPASLAASALAKDVLGSDETRTGGTGPWCWISTDADHKVMWMVMAGKGWEIACYLITVSLYVLLKVHLVLHHRRKKFHQIHVSLRDEDKNFLYVWFLLYILRMWGTIRFFLYVFRNPSEKEWYMKGLLRLQAFGDPGQAFCNFFLFCLLDKTVRTKLRHSLCCKTSKGSEDSNLLLPDHDDGNSVENINGDIHGYGSVSTTGSFRQFLNSSYSKPNRLC